MNHQRVGQKRWRRLAILGIVTLLSVAILGGLIPETAVAGVPIFGFHNIYDPANPREKPTNRGEVGLEYPIHNMEKFLTYVARQNYWTLTTQELDDYFIADKKLDIPLRHLEQRPILLSFDDGYKTIHTRLLPILEKLDATYKRKLTVVLFVNGGFLGKRGVFLEHMSCDDLRDGFQKGFYDIQSHTFNHKKLTTLRPHALMEEFTQDQATLRRCLGDLDPKKTVAKYVAYPFGADNPQIDRMAAKYYSLGFLYNGAMLRFSHHLNAKLGGKLDRYRIPRLTIGRDVSVSQLKKFAISSARWESLFLRIDEHGFWPHS